MTNKINVTLVLDGKRTLGVSLQFVPSKGERVIIEDSIYIVEALPEHTIKVIRPEYNWHHVRVYLKLLQTTVKQ